MGISARRIVGNGGRVRGFGKGAAAWLLMGALCCMVGCPLLGFLATVPNVVGMTQQAAENAITVAQRTVGTITEDNSDVVPAGWVMGQYPAGGERASRDLAVDLVISAGPALTTVPNVVGATEAAVGAIVNADLTPGTISQENSNTVSAGRVIRQDPAAGVNIPRLSAVNLVVSTGPTGSTGAWSLRYRFSGKWNQFGKAVAETDDGGFLVVCTTNYYSMVDYQYYPVEMEIGLLKTDGSGNVLWSKTITDGFGVRAHSVIQTADGGFAVTGEKNGGAPGNVTSMYVLKTDASGNVQWTKSFGRGVGQMSWGNSIVQTTDGGFAVAGITNAMVKYSSGDGKIYLVKTDAAGNLVWDEVYGLVGGMSGGTSVRQTADGGYIVAGLAEMGGLDEFDPRFYLVKTTSEGVAEWQKPVGASDAYFTLGGEDWEAGPDIELTTDGGYILGGGREGSEGDFFRQAYLLKMDGQGDQEWDATFGDSIYHGDFYEARGYSVVQTDDGGFALAGKEGISFWQPCIFRTDAAGNATQVDSYRAGPPFDWAQVLSLAKTADSGFVLAGYAEVVAENGYDPERIDVFVMKTDADGNAAW